MTACSNGRGGSATRRGWRTTDIGRALRPAARLVLLVRHERDRNEWATSIRQALDAVLRLLKMETLLADLDAGGGVYFDSRAWIVTARRPEAAGVSPSG